MYKNENVRLLDTTIKMMLLDHDAVDMGKCLSTNMARLIASQRAALLVGDPMNPERLKALAEMDKVMLEILEEIMNDACRLTEQALEFVEKKKAEQRESADA